MTVFETYKKNFQNIKRAKNLNELSDCWVQDDVSDSDFQKIKNELSEEFENKRLEFDTSGAETVVLKVSKWLAGQKGIPVVFEAVIKRETAKAYLVQGVGSAKKIGVCMACGRTLTNPVSIKYGLGVQCGGHWGIDPEGESEESIMKKISEVVDFETWIPKSQSEVMDDGE